MKLSDAWSLCAELDAASEAACARTLAAHTAPHGPVRALPALTADEVARAAELRSRGVSWAEVGIHLDRNVGTLQGGVYRSKVVTAPSARCGDEGGGARGTARLSPAPSPNGDTA